MMYFPSDQFVGQEEPDLDLAADYLELKAVFSEEHQSFSEDIISALELSSDVEFQNVDTEIRCRENIAEGAVARIQSRLRALEASYPFNVDSYGHRISFVAGLDLGQAAYLVSLILSNLRSLSPLLEGSSIHPSDQEARELRQYFQYFATAAIAAEVGGPAWSFGYPRPDRTNFIAKLSYIWSALKDGRVNPSISAPKHPKDDQIDVFSWRKQRDGLPGFMLVAAQVATGKDWKNKSIKNHTSVFYKRWFTPEPVTTMVAYHVIPFARPDDEFRDDVAVLGNILHRLRLPYRVAQAVSLERGGVEIEAFSKLKAVSAWLEAYLERGRRNFVYS